MPRPSPLQNVRERYGSKEKLVDAVIELLPARGDEAKDQAKKRLLHAANAKLLRLVDIGGRLRELGGTEAVARRIAELKGQPKDRDFLRKLGALAPGRLFDLLGRVERRAPRPAKKAE
jgi:hypothetical protein